ncbi:MAG: hypothetical protein ACK4TL_04795 [Hyphomicrobiaceae bacterium]
MMQESHLPEIVVCDVGADFPMEIAECIGERAYDLLDTATRDVSQCTLRLADRVSRSWFLRNNSAYFAEVEALAERARSPGIYYLNTSYEWGCTTAARPSPDGVSAVLQRTLDWEVNGIGRHIVAARIANPLGTWISLTWPAFTGVIQAVAPGRFAAAINQPTLARRVGLFALDRLLAHYEIWNSKHIQPIHLLRRVFETAPDFAAAREMLQSTPVSTPVIFTLAGIAADQIATIERLPTEHATTGDAFAANEWRAAARRASHYSAFENDARLTAIRAASPAWDPDLQWVRWPILNQDTRLAMMANPARGDIIARGYESGAPATRTLILHGTDR